MKKLLRFSSYVFSPLLIPVYATLFYFLVTRNYFYNHEIYLLFIQVLILTLLLPVSIFYLLRSLGLIRTKMLLHKNERRLPLAFYAVLLLILLKQSFSGLVIPELYYFFMGYLISIVFILLLVLFNIKISLHAMGIASLTVFIISISTYYHISFLYLIVFFILISGLVASSRLLANEQTLKGVAAGALAGIVSQTGLWFLWLIPVL